jgi:phage N-6-adenine-methyltransferase
MDNNTKKVMFSSKSIEWGTPDNFYTVLNKKFGPFTLDVCATKDNAKCVKYFTIKDDGLSQDWSDNICFMNPPYGRNLAGKWVEKAYNESQKSNTVVICLLPSRTDNKWFNNYCMKAKEIHFVKGRLKFGKEKNSAPFPSMVVIFDGSPGKSPTIFSIERS